MAHSNKTSDKDFLHQSSYNNIEEAYTAIEGNNTGLALQDRKNSESWQNITSSINSQHQTGNVIGT